MFRGVRTYTQTRSPYTMAMIIVKSMVHELITIFYAMHVRIRANKYAGRCFPYELYQVLVSRERVRERALIWKREFTRTAHTKNRYVETIWFGYFGHREALLNEMANLRIAFLQKPISFQMRKKFCFFRAPTHKHMHTLGHSFTLLAANRFGVNNVTYKNAQNIFSAFYVDRKLAQKNDSPLKWA